MNKAAIVALVLEKLDVELERYARAAREAQAGATDEQSKAENKYDTRGLEASYLAHGQSRHALETSQARQQIAAMELRRFNAADAIQLGALVQLAAGGEKWWHLLAPGAGGTEIFLDGEITVITPGSPVGGKLMGRHKGDRVDGWQILAVE